MAVHTPVDPSGIRVLDDIDVPGADEPSPVYSVDSRDGEVEQVDVLALPDILLAGGTVYDHGPDVFIALLPEPVDKVRHRGILGLPQGQGKYVVNGLAGSKEIGQDPEALWVALNPVEQECSTLVIDGLAADGPDFQFPVYLCLYMAELPLFFQTLYELPQVLVRHSSSSLSKVLPGCGNGWS